MADGVTVTVAVGVTVGEGVGLGLGVAVGVEIGVGEGDGVGVGFGRGWLNKYVSSAITFKRLVCSLTLIRGKSRRSDRDEATPRLVVTATTVLRLSRIVSVSSLYWPDG